MGRCVAHEFDFRERIAVLGCIVSEVAFVGYSAWLIVVLYRHVLLSALVTMFLYGVPCLGRMCYYWFCWYFFAVA